MGEKPRVARDVERLIEARRPAMAFTLGGMGSAQRLLQRRV